MLMAMLMVILMAIQIKLVQCVMFILSDCNECDSNVQRRDDRGTCSGEQHVPVGRFPLGPHTRCAQLHRALHAAYLIAVIYK